MILENQELEAAAPDVVDALPQIEAKPWWKFW